MSPTTYMAPSPRVMAVEAGGNKLARKWQQSCHPPAQADARQHSEKEARPRPGSTLACRCEVDPDGKISVVTGKPGTATSSNPWDAEIERLTKQ